MKGIVYILVCVILNVAGQTSIKHGTRAVGELSMGLSKLGNFFVTVVKQPFIILGIFLYGISAFFWIGALSKSELSFAYPFLSIGYVLILFISWRLFGESINIFRLIGVFLIIGGMFFLMRSV
jgi:multidrug transporter EmrE-like cation transporter